VATPGNGFGPSGEGYIRFALTRDEDRLREAAQRIQNLE
jgi:aspartate/methionine/tyrosine aminotransferase